MKKSRFKTDCTLKMSDTLKGSKEEVESSDKEVWIGKVFIQMAWTSCCALIIGQTSVTFSYRVRQQNFYTLIFANKFSAAETAEL